MGGGQWGSAQDFFAFAAFVFLVGLVAHALGKMLRASRLVIEENERKLALLRRKEEPRP